MKFNLKQFLVSISFVLDYIEIDILDDITNHSKRVAYLALKLGDEFNLTGKEKFSLLAFSIMHDIGGVENKKGVTKSELEKVKNHCVVGENTINKFPIINEYNNIILYHHENIDGSGFFKKKGNEIPLFSQIISLADFFELNYGKNQDRASLISKVIKQKNIKFSEKMINIFLKIIKQESFWLNLEDTFVLDAVKEESPDYSTNYSYKNLHKITEVFSEIIDSKSKYTRNHSRQLSEKANVIAKYYSFSDAKRHKLILAADLHDLGKLAVPNSILNKSGKLTKQEYQTVKAHSFYSRKALEQIDGFEDIASWAGNHHEKNDGSGYPKGLKEENIDFPSQILVALDIYQALRENRPYRNSLTHTKAIEVLNNMAVEGKLNSNVTASIEKIYR